MEALTSLKDLREIYHLPLFELMDRAHQIHKRHHSPGEIQKCSLFSLKTGRCPEDCSYCPQSAHYKTKVDDTDFLDFEEMKTQLQKAKEQGATRFCMGVAWREVRDGPQFESILEMVRIMKAANMEACVTLGMLTDKQAMRLKEAGLDAYNHNLDTSRDYYPKIISTRTYDDRLKTIASVQKAGIQVCSGGIIGMGESIDDRLKMLLELAKLDPPPESLPINLLIPIEGTPLEKSQRVPSTELVRLIATTRILIEKTRIRLSAGRTMLSDEAQLMCFYVGASSIFVGEKLLTRENPEISADERLLSEMV